MSNLVHALALAQAGRHVFPCAVGEKSPHTRLCPNGVHDATTGQDVITRWWTDTPDANIGIACAPSGLVVLDYDRKYDPEGHELAALYSEFGMDVSDVTCVSANGGYHWYFQAAPDVEYGKHWRGKQCFDQIARGYVVAPPSRLSEFNTLPGQCGTGEYEWRECDHQTVIPLAPPWLTSRAQSSIPRTDANSAANRLNKIDDVLATELRSALSALSADDYHEWIRVGLALHFEDSGGDTGFELWDTWSATSAKYGAGNMDGTTAAKWHTFADDKSLNNCGRGTIFQMAGERGWVNPAKAVAVPVFKAPPAAGDRPWWFYPDLLKLPDPAFRIVDVLPEVGVGWIYGEPNVGKSLFALYMAARVAHGGQWFGHDVVACPGRVAYIALEGRASTKLRAAALAEVCGFPPDIVFKFDFQLSRQGRKDEANNPVPLPDGRPDLGDVGNLIRDVAPVFMPRGEPAGGLIVIDTFAAATPGMKENDVEHAGAAISFLRGIANALQCLVLVLHHPGKNLDNGMRGSSLLLGDADVVINLARADDEVAWRVEKARDSTAGVSGRFQVREVDFHRVNRYGQPVRSAAAVELAGPAPAGKAKKQSKGEQAVEAVRAALLARGMEHPDLPDLRADEVNALILRYVSPKPGPDGQVNRKSANTAVRRVINDAAETRAWWEKPGGGFTLDPTGDGNE